MKPCERFLDCFQNESTKDGCSCRVGIMESQSDVQAKSLEAQKCLIKTELAGKWTRDTES